MRPASDGPEETPPEGQGPTERSPAANGTGADRQGTQPPGVDPQSPEGASGIGKLVRSGALSVAESLQARAATHVADGLRAQDPSLLSRLAEIGVVRQAWIDDPEDGPVVSDTRAVEVLQRAVEARADRRPGVLGRLAISGLRVLTDLGLGGAELGAADATLCFTDLEGFTEFTALEGDEVAKRLLERYYTEAGRIVRTRNGVTVKQLGDGLLLRFNDPLDAVRAALDIVLQGADPLRIRAGLHKGELVVEHGDVFGNTVNVTARVADAAEGGQVMISAEVREAVEGTTGLEFGRLKRRRFKGVAARMEVCEVHRV